MCFTFKEWNWVISKIYAKLRITGAIKNTKVTKVHILVARPECFATSIESTRGLMRIIPDSSIIIARFFS